MPLSRRLRYELCAVCSLSDPKINEKSKIDGKVLVSRITRSRGLRSKFQRSRTRSHDSGMKCAIPIIFKLLKLPITRCHLRKTCIIVERSKLEILRFTPFRLIIQEWKVAESSHLVECCLWRRQLAISTHVSRERLGYL